MQLVIPSDRCITGCFFIMSEEATFQQSPLRIVGIDKIGSGRVIPINRKRAYVAGGFYGNKDTTLTLGYASDTLTRRFGDRVFEQMLRDPEIIKCITVLKVGVLSDGVNFFPRKNKPANVDLPYMLMAKPVPPVKPPRFSSIKPAPSVDPTTGAPPVDPVTGAVLPPPPVDKRVEAYERYTDDVAQRDYEVALANYDLEMGRYTSELEKFQRNQQRYADFQKRKTEYERAKAVSDFCTRAIDNLDKPFRETLYKMLDAIVYGHKVAEQTYIEVAAPTYLFENKLIPRSQKTVYMLDSMRIIPRKAVAFVIDGFQKILGFKAAVPQTVRNEDGTTREEVQEVVIQRDKFMLLTFRGLDEDPRGTSILEAVYNAWHLKMQMWPEYLRWLLQCAIPGLVGYTSPEADQKQILRDEDGNVVRDAAGNPVYAAEVDSLLAALVQMRNSTAIALPAGAKVETINNQTTGDPFKSMRDVMNEEIEMALLLQTLATSEGRHMSRAAALSHMSVLDLLVYFIKGMLVEMIRNDVLKPLIKYNFPNLTEEELYELIPNVAFGDTERREFASDAQAVAALHRSGFIGKSQLVGFDKMLGAPERDVESDDLERAASSTAQAQTVIRTIKYPEDNEPDAEGRDAAKRPIAQPPAVVQQAAPKKPAANSTKPTSAVGSRTAKGTATASTESREEKIDQLKILVNELVGEEDESI